MSLLKTVTVEVLDDEVRLYRVCGPDGADEFLDALRSHYELRRPPRGPENRAAVIHMALSMFDQPRPARELAEPVPQLGGHVATLALRPGLGICVAKTGAPTHWSVWGRPTQLAACITDVVPAGNLRLS